MDGIPMPEAAVKKYGGPILPGGKVGIAGNALRLIPEMESLENFSELQFWPGVF